MKLPRRRLLQGLGGAILGLPWLESLDGVRVAHAQTPSVPSYAIFFRQANGVAAIQTTEIGAEPERFWPRTEGALDAQNLEGRALVELQAYASRLLVVGNANMNNFP